jgi:hypothetical protein
MQELKNNKANAALITMVKTGKVFIDRKYSGSQSTLVPGLFKSDFNDGKVHEERAIIKCVLTSTARSGFVFEFAKTEMDHDDRPAGIKNRFMKTSGR